LVSQYRLLQSFERPFAMNECLIVPRIRRAIGEKFSRKLWISNYGSYAKPFELRHRCDNWNCIRLSHLELGTHAENMNDMAIARRRFEDEKLTINGRITLKRATLKRANPSDR